MEEGRLPQQIQGTVWNLTYRKIQGVMEGQHRAVPNELTLELELG